MFIIINLLLFHSIKHLFIFLFTCYSFDFHIFPYLLNKKYIVALDHVIDDTSLEITRKYYSFDKIIESSKCNLITNLFTIVPAEIFLLKPQIINHGLYQPLHIFFLNLFIHFLLSNILFDFFHTIFHLNSYFKRFHFKHHFIKIPYCIDTFIAHPIDNILGPILADIIPFLIICYIPTGKIGIIVGYQINMIIATIIHSKYKISNANRLGSFFENHNWLVLGNHSLHHYNNKKYDGNDPLSKFLIKNIFVKRF